MPIRLTRFHTPEERALIEKVSQEVSVVKETGEIVYGAESTIQALQTETAQIVLITRYGKREIINKLKYLCKLSDTPFFMFPGDVRELGEACDRPHGISALAVLNSGSSDILKLNQGEDIESR